jgi:RNA polymerase sigma-70 factor (ECF subfamily)
MKDADSHDRELVQRCMSGDTKAFDELVGRYQKTMFNVALRMTGDFDAAEEVTQEAFVKAYERLPTFNPKYKFYSWVYRILVNGALDHLEHTRKHARLSDQMASGEPGPEETEEREDAEAILRTGLLELDVKQRAVLVLRHFEELTYEEIGAILGISEKKVKSRLFSARLQLRTVLVKKGLRFHEQ